ncbi:MAG TPA: hypothetical protein VMX55_09840 [candidate division Zixibacteria bacterium]|nr:hypothetical protein [candidate division Zixibacteria bacterium]
MKIKFKIIISIAIIALIILPLSTQFVSAENDEISVKEGQDAISIVTEFITFKIIDNQPHFIWWNGNRSTSDEIYNVKYTTIQEYFGNDEVIDIPSELHGISYNLLTADWLIDIIEEETEITVTLSLSGLPNKAEIQFVIHIYNNDQPITDTDKTVTGLKEVKFDIIIKNWQFQVGAKGIAINAKILESQQRNRVKIRNGTSEENGNKTRTMQFESEEHGNVVVAYYEWSTFADIYDGEEKVSTIDVGTSYFSDFDHNGQNTPDPSIINQWLSYPNYGDSLTMIHDPSVGINSDIPTNIVPLYTLSIFSGLIATALIISILRKRN